MRIACRLAGVRGFVTLSRSDIRTEFRIAVYVEYKARRTFSALQQQKNFSALVAGGSQCACRRVALMAKFSVCVHTMQR